MKGRMDIILRTIFIPGLFALLALCVSYPAVGATTSEMSNYCSTPPFLNNTVPPNVLIVLDNSGSMNGEAYSTTFNPAQFSSGHYFGYFEPDKMYRYTGSGSGGQWAITTDDPSTGTAANPIASGDFLNWATMRRIEAAKMLLIGGKQNPRSPNPGQTVKVVGETVSDSFSKDYKTYTTTRPTIYPFHQGYYKFSRNSDDLTITLVQNNQNPLFKAASVHAVPGTWTYGGSATSYLDAIDDPLYTVTYPGPPDPPVLTPVASDYDNSYIEQKTTATWALYNIEDLNTTDFPFAGSPSTISKISVYVAARRMYSGSSNRTATYNIQANIGVGASNVPNPPNAVNPPLYYNSASLPLNTNSNWYEYVFDWTVNPRTGAAWTWDDIKGATSTPSANQLQVFGVTAKTTPNANLYPRVSRIYVMITAVSPSGGPYQVVIDTGRTKQTGIIDDLEGDARFGLAFYNNGAGIESGYANGRNDGGEINTYVDFGTPTAMITAIENLTASTWTPLAETLYEMIRSFRQDPPYYTGNSPADYQTGQNYDPYYFRYSRLAGSNLPDQYVPCAKSFILMLTDGESTQDKNIPSNLRDYDHDGKDTTFYVSNGTDYLDDVALWGRTVDNRPDLAGNQNIILYSVYMFGEGSQLLKDAAINGGFNDLNGDNRPGPDIREYLRDSNKDGAITSSDLPLTYFEGSDGYALKASITEAIAAILKRAASGTAVSVLTTSSRGVGSIVQAYFLPVRQEGMREITWTGYAQNIWLDPFDNLREDTVNDLTLKLADDRVLKLYYDASANETMAATFTTDADGNSDPAALGSLGSCSPAETKKFAEVTSLWEAGQKLALRLPSSRTMFTAKKVVHGASTTNTFTSNDFNVTNVTTSAALSAALNPDATYTAENIVRYIRGECLETGVNGDTACGSTANTTFRDRRLTVNGGSANGNVWKLGDIINSTPKIAGNMALNYYHIDYGDGTYFNFITSDAYKRRMAISVLGANDGMLHAIKLGYLKDTDDSVSALAANVKALFKNLFSDSDSTHDQVGEEAWTYIPFNAFPYLKYLADPDYCHVYYSDLTTRIVDVSIGGSTSDPTDARTPNSWRSVLIGGMNFGGACSGGISPAGPPTGTPANVGFSAYFAIDVTDPANPVPLWEFSDPDMGYATTYPSILRTGGMDKNGYWYVAFGSGSKQLPKSATDISRTSPGYVFIVDVKTGQLAKKIQLDHNAIVGDIIAVDADLDNDVENLYFGTAYKTTSWQGKLMNIAIPNQDLSAAWAPQVTTLFTGNYPFTASPDAVLDDKRNTWVYIGSGKFNSDVDKTDASQQIFLGIKHVSGITYPLTVSALDDRTAFQTTGTVLSTRRECLFDPTTNSFGMQTIVTSINPTSTPPDPSAKGWYLRLSTVSTAERVISRPLAVGGLVDFVTYKPNADPCAGGGDSFLYAVSYLTGVASSNVAIVSPDITNRITSGAVTVQKGVKLGAGAPPKGEAISLTPPKDDRELKKKIQVGTGVIIETANEAPLSMFSKFVHWLKK